MNQEYVEHANFTVKDLAATVEFLAAALPTWRIRGEGRMNWLGKPIRWLHFGSDTSYLAMQDGGEGSGAPWTGNQVGSKHVGIVVPSIDALVERLKRAGYELDHWGEDHPFRKRVYYVHHDNLQFEFVEYTTEDTARRNDYSDAAH